VVALGPGVVTRGDAAGGRGGRGQDEGEGPEEGEHGAGA
jgi:hypothetical protein